MIGKRSSGDQAIIPLHRPDLTALDGEAVARQLAVSPFFDDTLVSRWEQVWSQVWERRAVMFDDPEAAMGAIKEALEWDDGTRIAAGAGWHPAWREGCAAAWIRIDTLDANVSIPVHGPCPGVVIEHFQGLPAAL
ncbi:MAG: hypothetical protein HQL73_13800 [Magnetococcales bacterium]|nr:hypothetical protein [Magnetococcales bacterium]